MNTTPERLIAALAAMSPCPIIHGTNELPPGGPEWDRPSRSRYFNRRSGRRGRSQDFILINEGPARHWNYAFMLAHELGHALDHHGLHPAQSALRGPRGRYRQELAAVAMSITVARQVGLDRTKRGREWVQRDRDYLKKYARGENPRLDEVLGAMPRRVVEI